jgi:hypothetical protein
MSITVNRRHFLRQSCAAAGATLFLGPAEFAFAGGAPKVQLDAADRTALQFIGQYSGNVLLRGGTVAAKLAGVTPATTNILALIDNVPALDASLGSPRAKGVADLSINGNTASFTAGGRLFEAENLLPAEFFARLADLNVGRNIAFAHEAIQLRPVNGEFRDPLHAGRALILERQPADIGAALGDVLEGLIQASQFALKPDPKFAARQKTVLATDATAPDPAGTATVAFVKNLTALAATVQSTGIADLLGSRLVTTAFMTHLSVQTSGIVSDFKQLRAQLAPSYSDAAIWLAIILAPEIADGIANPWIDNQSSYPRIAAARKALAQARSLVNEPAFTRLQASA